MAPAAPVKLIATAYDSCEKCTGKTPGHQAFGITSSGLPAQPDRTVAVDPDVIPIGTWILVEGLGVFRAEDTGGCIKGHRMDIYRETHEEALEFGIQEVTAWVLEPAF